MIRPWRLKVDSLTVNVRVSVIFQLAFTRMNHPNANAIRSSTTLAQPQSLDSTENDIKVNVPSG